MPIFLNAIIGFAMRIAGRQASFLTYRFAALTLFLSFIAISVVALFSLLFTMLSGASAAVPTTAIMVWGWFMPSNAFSCFALILSARILRAVYDYKIEVSKRVLAALNAKA
jgi:hypothetical protein